MGCWIRSGISGTTCKSAPCCRQITTPAPTPQFFTDRMPFLPPKQQRQSMLTAASIKVTHTRTRTRTHTHTHTHTHRHGTSTVRASSMNCTWLSPQVSTRPSVISSTVWLAPADTCVHTWDNEDELQLAGHATFTGTALHHTPSHSTTAPNLASASKSNDNCHWNFRGTLVKCYNVSIILQIVFL